MPAGSSIMAYTACLEELNPVLRRKFAMKCSLFLQMCPKKETQHDKTYTDYKLLNICPK